MSATPLGLSGRYLFFTGKGGVGKTTVACATAITLADAGERVLLVSTDPASNLDEMLGVTLGMEPREVPGVPGLFAANIDPNEAAEAYRQRALAPYEGQVGEAELASMREALSGACTVEIAAFDRFAGLLAGDGEAFSRIVFDTAPTGHTLRLLELPRAWTHFFDVNMRGASCLGPHSALTLRRERFEAARATLADPKQTRMVLVARPDTPSLREAARTSEELTALGIAGQMLVVNGVFRASSPDDPIARALEDRGRAALASMPEKLEALARVELPLRPFEMVGLPALRAVLGPEGAGPSITPVESEIAPELPAFGALVDALAATPKGLVMVMGKGGVGKTTVASALAVALCERGIEVHLSTTDPAAHVAATIEGALPGLEVSRIDPKRETEAYIERVMATKGKDLDSEGRALLLEDLRSPCTEEVAVFHAFSRLVSQARGKLVVLDTAPTGHTLLLLDATGAYHRDVLRGMDEKFAAHVTTPMMRLADPAFTRILLVTLPETTPVSEAARLQDDLRRAGIEPWAWVVNASLLASGVRDPLLRMRLRIEEKQLERVRTSLSRRMAVLPWRPEEPRGVAELRALGERS
jgi:arsenite-transporting ATPase